MASMYLVRYPEIALRVQKKKAITIGRMDSNEIVLHESRVSRFHAKVEWNLKKEIYTLCDVGSSNGTFLNSKKIETATPVQITDRDKFRIASSIFTCRLVETAHQLDNEYNSLKLQQRSMVTEVILIEDIKKIAEEPAAFKGELEHICPIELFQMLEFGGKTGVVFLKTKDKAGTFSVYNGQIITAAFGNSTGESAVFEVLRYNHGTFAFNAAKIQTERPEITSNTTTLLIEGCRLLDEAANIKADHAS
ncbi:MAG: DUF4388 domain-containing protein [Chitinivibrionales bacterium]|nr:DUF4388 domain-containing protein [Chitinivibrionales bacterium]